MIPPSDENRWYTPGVECKLCHAHGTELVWFGEGYICRDAETCRTARELEELLK